MQSLVGQALSCPSLFYNPVAMVRPPLARLLLPLTRKGWFCRVSETLVTLWVQHTRPEWQDVRCKLTAITRVWMGGEMPYAVVVLYCTALHQYD